MSSIVDNISEFALKEHRLFPCDNAMLTKASIEAFEVEGHRLPAKEKLAAARFMSKKASEQGLRGHGRSLALTLGSNAGVVGDHFKSAMDKRAYALEGKKDYSKRIRDMCKVAKRIVSDFKPEDRLPLLDVCVEKLAALDVEATTDVGREFLSRLGCPDAADTVFRVDSVPDPDPEGVVVGDRIVTKEAFAGLDKTAAEKSLSADGLKYVESYEAFSSAPEVAKGVIASFIPEAK